MPAVQEQNTFYNNHFIEIAQIQQMEQLQYLFALATKLTEMRKAHDPALKKMLETYTVAVMFYQQSSRTFGSFVSAARGLGATVIDVHDMEHYSSVAKGENLTDSAMTASQSWGANLIVQRHPENNSSKLIAAELDAHETGTKAVNAGAGTEEHPTQALLDAYTIYNRFDRLDHLHIVMVGDMKFGRTVKSLAQLLANVGEGNRITFVAPKGLEMTPDVLAKLEGKVEVVQQKNLEGLEGADVVYWTRIQREWFVKEGQLDLYDAVRDLFILTPEVAGQFSGDTVFMHPLPRLGEIERRVDKDPRALYLKEQMSAGLSVRMALIAAILLENPLAGLQAVEAGSDAVQEESAEDFTI
jgi:aspartate carbamoyltransferase catalytic subunit